MFSVSRRTFKELVDNVLKWTGDAENQGTMRELVQDAIRKSHETRLTEARFTFMLFPKEQSFTTVAGQRSYSLHEAFLSPLFFHNETYSDPVNPVTASRVTEFRSVERGRLKYVALQGVSHVKNQPTADGVVTATSSAPGDNGKQVIIVGETANGIEEETLTVPTAGSKTFLTGGIIDIIKLGEDWAGTLTVTGGGSVTLLTLSAAQYGRQFRQLYSLNDQAGGDVIKYQFFRQPKPLRYDTDVPDTPYPFDRIHQLDALIDLAGFTRASATEIKRWKDEVVDLENGLDLHYSDSNATDSEVDYQVLVPR